MAKAAAQKGLTFDLPLDVKPAEAAKPAPTKEKKKAKAPESATSKGNLAVVEHKVLPANESLAASLLRATENPKVDAAKLAELYKTQKEVVADEARLTFIRQFRFMRARLPEIDQDGRIVIRDKVDKNTIIQSTGFASFNNIMRVCEPILREFGFSVATSTDPSPDGTRLIVSTTLYHDDGHERVTRFPLPCAQSGSQTTVQGWGSTQSFGKRYGLVALLQIVSYDPLDRDTDGNAPARKIAAAVRKNPPKGEQEQIEVVEGAVVEAKVKTITQQQADDLGVSITDCGVGVKKFCQHYQIEKVEDLPASRLTEAVSACENYKTKTK